MTHRSTIHLGFEVGTGMPVEIPLAHTFVTGQTQLSGKTTTLRAIVERSGQRALAFVTKRGEEFEGRRILPYLPREGEKPIHWRLVETLLASALGQRNMKWERFQIMNAAKGARSLADVRANVVRLAGKGSSRGSEIYTMLGEYLDLILPEMRELAAADALDLQPGLNVMDLGGVGPQLQALVIRAALEQINQHERGVLTVFPEAWEFAPRARSAPAKDEAIAMARKGAVLGNFLLCDSQDIAGVDTVIRQATSVWILGVQREINELKRTIDSIPAGIAKPKAAEVATLELGQFFACWGRHVVRTYVQPAWLDASTAEAVARGEKSSELLTTTLKRRRQQEASTVTNEQAARLTRENEQLKADNAELRRRLEALERGAHDVKGTRRSESDRPATRQGVARDADDVDASRRDGVRSTTTGTTGRSARTFTAEESFDNEALYQAIKARLIEEVPALLRVLTDGPELEVQRTRRVIEVEGDTLKGRLAGMIASGFFDQPKKGYTAFMELQRLGAKVAKPGVYNMCDQLAKDGFLTKEGDEGYRAVQGMKVNVVER